MRILQNGFDRFLLILGISTVILIIYPDILLLFLMTFVFAILILPLAYIPATFLVLFLVRVIQRQFVGLWSGVSIGLIGTIALLTIPTLWFNAKVDREVRTLVANDHDNLKKPLNVRILAMRAGRNVYHDRFAHAHCDDFCLRTLLNKQAERFLFDFSEEDNIPLNLEKPVQSFRMERRVSCPEVKLNDSLDRIEIEEEKTTGLRSTPSELMRLEISTGNCLIVETATLGQADVILSRMSLKKDDLTKNLADMDPRKNEIRADRITVHVRDGDVYQEVYRWTGVVAKKLFSLLLPIIVDGPVYHFKFSLMRDLQKTNIEDKYYKRPNWGRFATKTLGMKLGLDFDSAKDQTRIQIIKTLDKHGVLSPADQQLVKDYVRGLVSSRSFDPADHPIVERLLADRRVPVPDNAWGLVQKAKPLNTDYFKSLAQLLFKRLHEIKIADGPKADNSVAKREAGAIATAIKLLPDDAIHPHRADLEWLARDAVLRNYASSALPRLSVFGPDAAPMFLALIDDVYRIRRDRDNFKSGDSYADANTLYSRALQGLCQTAPFDAASLQALIDRVASKTIPSHTQNYRRIVTVTLARHAVHPDKIWELIRSNDNSFKRQWMENWLKNPEDKRNCGW